MVDVLNPEELGLIRTEIEGWFPETCDIYRLTSVDDSAGGEDQTEALIAAGIICELQSGVALHQEEVIAGRFTGTQLFTVTLPANTDIQVGDHLVVRTRGDLHIRVQSVFAPESWEFERRVVGSREGEHLA